MVLVRTTLDPGLRRDDSFKAISPKRRAIGPNRKAFSPNRKVITLNSSKAITSNNVTPAKAGVQCR